MTVHKKICKTFGMTSTLTDCPPCLIQQHDDRVIDLVHVDQELGVVEGCWIIPDVDNQIL